MTSTRQPIRKSARKSKTAIAERNGRPKKVIRNVVVKPVTVTVGDVRKEETSFTAPVLEEVFFDKHKKKKVTE